MPTGRQAKSKIIDYAKIDTDFDLKIPGEHNIKRQGGDVCGENFGY